ncbi:MAG: N-acetylmuramoyl-L-alanine amidase family protein [Defluviitaleaceae bacterium]|nr:N-acetylmuramoyl-L-alanine amidase family protein [Defluviitaleaceae bacterium]
MRKTVSFLTFFSIIFFCFNIVFASNVYGSAINLVVDGSKVENPTAPPVILNDFTMVGARDVFEGLGAHVSWNEAMRLVYIAYGRDLVILQIDSTVAHLNDAPIMMEVAPQIIDGWTMIPVRFAAENLGFIVGWDPDSRTVSIDTPNQPPIVTMPPVTPPASGAGGENPSKPGSGEIVLARDVSPNPLTNMNFPQTSIIAINIIESSRQAIEIVAASEISVVETTLLPDNRLVIDFHNAEMTTDTTEFIPGTRSAYNQVRIAQFEVEPVKITRVVVELQSGIHYSITMPEDRRSLNIDFERNNITNISHRRGFDADYITITGLKTPAVNISHLSNPQRLVIDMPFSQINLHEISVNSPLVGAARPGQFNEDTARVVLDLADRVSFSVSTEGNSVTIRVTEPTFRNIWYDNDNRVLRLSRGQLNASSIVKNDMYLSRRYEFILTGNFSEEYGFGRYEINDSNMSFIDIETIDGITRLTANTRNIMAATITEDNNYIYISFRNPREVYDRIVVIDPGHGGAQPGTTAGPIHEKYLVLDVAMMLYEMFNNSNSGIRVYSTRLSDVTVSLPARAALANEIGDIFVSIHMNSVYPNRAPHGTETFYHSREASFYNGFTSGQLAEIFQRHMLERLGTNDRGVKRGAFDVLVFSQVPAILCEIGFLSNPYEAARLQDPVFQRMAAEALYNATLEAFSVYTPRR